jgi:hypothetical protein
MCKLMDYYLYLLVDSTLLMCSWSLRAVFVPT